MSSFRRLALLLALGLPAMHAIQAQSTSSSSTPASPAQDSAQQPQQTSVQARIRARREQRREAAIREVYSHLYEAYVGAGYTRFTLPSPLQRVNEYSWDVGLTRYFNERLGVTLDGRGIYGTAFINPTSTGGSGIYNPSISQYAALIGPTYRFYLQPRYSIAGRVMGGFVQGNFSGDTSGFGSKALGLYPDSSTFGISASVIGEYNISPNLGVRIAPEYFATGFGSSLENNLGFTGALVYRFGKQ